MSLARQPDTGGRFSLLLLEHDAARARFELILATPGGQWTALAQVAASDGSVELDASGDAAAPPPRWLVQYARAALRSAWHSHREQGWPRRMTRWRDVPARDGSPGARDEG